MCVDFRKLNEHTISDRHPLGNINDILDQLGHSRYTTTLDLASGFHQIPLHLDSQDKTAFSCNYGHYEFKRMCFGLKNAPASFQRFLNSILTGLQGIKCLVYLDDIIIYGKNLQDHNEKLVDVFEVLRKNKLKLQPSKCQFLQKEIMYLGHNISERGILPDLSKIDVIKNYPVPHNVNKVKSFLGLANYYRKFVPDFSSIIEPINRLLKKNCKFVWTEQCENSFQLIKAKIMSPQILAFPDFEKPFVLTTDASNIALGAVLSQKENDKCNFLEEIDRPVAFASRLLNGAEKNYHTMEKEMLAVVWGINNFRPYLYGRFFTVITDHKPLLGDTKNTPLRILKWKLKLSEYSFTLVYKMGRENVVADALSRICEERIFITTRSQKKLLKGEKIKKLENKESKTKVQKKPMTGAEIMTALEPLVPVELKEQIKNSKSNFKSNGINIRIILDDKEKLDIIKEAHNSLVGGHQGVYRTFTAIHGKVRWRNMLNDVAKFIRNCSSCKKNKSGIKTKVPMAITSTSFRPFEKVFVDVVGLLPLSMNGNKYILTLQDDLSKYTMAAPMVNQEASTVAQTFFNNFISIIGIPESILTDQGTNFMSKMFAELCKLLKISKINTSSYHPQTNQVESWHKSLAEFLRHFVNCDHSNWDEFLPSATFCYNTHTHLCHIKNTF